MLHFLPVSLRAILAIFLFLPNTVFHGTLTVLLSPLKWVLPFSGWRWFWSVLTLWVAGRFIRTNDWILGLCYRIEWDVEGLENLSPEGSYLVISNHLSLVDIPVVQSVFLGQIPFLRFFIKEQLLWVPFLGQALWALGYPTMKRYSKEVLKKRPELRGKDLETAKRSCDKFRGHPVTMLNYVEGTRFTAEKHTRTKSSFTHLLKPRAGGIYTVLDSLGDQLTAVLDVTLAYPGHSSPNFRDLLFGRIAKIVVRIDSLKLGENGVPSHEIIQAKGGALAVRKWLNERWIRKDKILALCKNEEKLSESGFSGFSGFEDFQDLPH